MCFWQTFLQVGDRDEKLAEGIKLHAISTTSTSKRTILSDVIMVRVKKNPVYLVLVCWVSVHTNSVC